MALSEHATSLDAPFAQDPLVSLIDLLPSAMDNNPDTCAEQKEMSIVVRVWLERLTDKQRNVIIHRFCLDNDDPSTLEELAVEIGVTRE